MLLANKEFNLQQLSTELEILQHHQSAPGFTPATKSEIPSTVPTDVLQDDEGTPHMAVQRLWKVQLLSVECDLGKSGRTGQDITLPGAVQVLTTAHRRVTGDDCWPQGLQARLLHCQACFWVALQQPL